jgi:hypothetical protein
MPAPATTRCSCFNQFGDRERCALRPGNVHSADGWKDALDAVVARYRDKVSRPYFRADAGSANPDVYEFLEERGSSTPSARKPVDCRSAGRAKPGSLMREEIYCITSAKGKEG